MSTVLPERPQWSRLVTEDTLDKEVQAGIWTPRRRRPKEKSRETELSSSGPRRLD